MGRTQPPARPTMRLRLTGRLGRRDGRKAQLQGGRRAALSFAVGLASGMQIGSGHSAALAEFRHPDGDFALAFETVGHYDRDALFCPLRAEQILAVVWGVQPAVGRYSSRHEWA
jgi:hypothetical protein